MNNQIRIFLVDDNPFFLEATTEFLGMEDAFMVAGSATSGQSALAQIAELQPDIVLLDLNLGDQSGLELIPRIKTLLANTKIIILTMIQEQAYEDAAKQAGASGYVSKIAIASNLFPTIKSVMNGSFPIDRVAGLDKAISRAATHFPEAVMTGLYFYNNPLPMWVYNLKSYKFLDVNNAAISKYGYSREEFLSMNLADIRPEEEKDRLIRDLERPRSKFQHSGVWKHQLKDGTLIDVEIHSHSIKHKSVEAVLVVAIDITERLESQEKLQASEERFRTLVNSTNDIVYTLDPEQRHTGVFGPWVENAGLTPEYFLGKTAEEVFDAEIASVHQQANQRVLNGEHVIYEWSIPSQAGTQFYQTSVSPLRSADGAVSGIVGVGRDVTSQKTVEAALQESERFSRSTLDALTAHIAILDNTGKIIAVNHAWREFAISNHPDPDSVCEGANYLAVCENASGPDSREANYMASALRKVIAGSKDEFIQEYPCHAPDEQRWFIARVTQFEGDGPLRIVVAHENITARKLSEQTLSQSENALKKAQSVASVGSWVWHVKEDRLEWSDEMYRIFGIDKDTFSGQLSDVIVNAIHPDDRLLVENSNLAVAAENSPQPLEYRVVWPDGTIRTIWGEAGELVTDADGKADILTGIVQDITERKKAQAELLGSEKRYREIFNGVQDAIFVESLDGRILDVNTRACEMYGYTRKQFLSKTVYDLVPEGQNIYLIGGQEYLTQPIETINRRANGDLFPIEISGQATTINGEKVILVIVRDNSRRKLAEETTLQRMRELSTINRISKSLRETSSKQKILDIVMDELLSTLSTDHGEIILWDEKRARTEQAIARGWFVKLSGYPIENGKGIYGYVLDNGTTYCSRDFSSDVLTLPESRKAVPAGWGGVCVPLKSEETVSGVLAISVPQDRQLSDGEIHLMETVAEMAGAALRRASLHENVERHLSRVQSLRIIDQAIIGGSGLKNILSLILDQAISQLSVDAVSLTLVYNSGEGEVFTTGKGLLESKEETHTLNSFARQAIQSKKSIWIDDVAATMSDHASSALWQTEGITSYHAVPLLSKDHVKGILEVFHRDQYKPDQEWVNFLETLAGQAVIAIENNALFEDLEIANNELLNAYDATIEGWSMAMDLRDKETEGHTRRVTEITLALARRLGIGEEELVHIRRGALLHDIGKIGIPDQILLRPGKLSDEEWVLMKMHPQFAYNMLEPIPYLKPAINIPYCHHEKWDGSGYPRGLQTDEIPLAARIFAVGDVYDALTSDRPYREAWPKQKALAYIREQAGKHFDPDIVSAFFEMMNVTGAL